jgi:hypothetical protein
MLLILLSLALLAYTTMSFVGGIYANRAALPIVGVMFVAILIFGAVW